MYCWLVQKSGLTSLSTTRAVATVIARTRADVTTTSPGKTSISSSTTSSLDRPFDRPPPVHTAVIQPRSGDATAESPRRPRPRVLGLRLGEQTLVTLHSLTAKPIAASQTMNKPSSSSSLLRGRLATTSSTTYSEQLLSQINVRERGP